MIIDYIHLALFLRYAKDVGPAATCDVQVRQWEMKYSDSALPGGPFLSTLGNETWLWIFPHLLMILPLKLPVVGISI